MTYVLSIGTSATFRLVGFFKNLRDLHGTLTYVGLDFYLILMNRKRVDTNLSSKTKQTMKQE